MGTPSFVKSVPERIIRRRSSIAGATVLRTAISEAARQIAAHARATMTTDLLRIVGDDNIGNVDGLVTLDALLSGTRVAGDRFQLQGRRKPIYTTSRVPAAGENRAAVKQAGEWC